MNDLQELKLTAFQYAMDILSKPEISMHLKHKSLDVFELSNQIFNYLIGCNTDSKLINE